jgi:hypothetical protein
MANTCDYLIVKQWSIGHFRALPDPLYVHCNILFCKLQEGKEFLARVRPAGEAANRRTCACGNNCNISRLTEIQEYM